MTSPFVERRKSGTGRALWIAALAALLCAPTLRMVRAQGPDVGSDSQRESGKQLYGQYCSQCHGDNGDGGGYAAPRVLPKPRDFTAGKFKVRTTPTGELPTHQDLVSVIRRGMPYTSMPAWPSLSDRQISDIAYYIKTFSPDFANPDLVPTPVELPGAPASTEESIELGKKLYVDTGCVRCHGTLGRGDGPSAPTLTDDWGDRIRAADLTQSWTFRGGSSREDIFRTMSTGFNGTPMPGFVDALTPEQRWAITDFIVSLSGSSGPNYTNLVVARPAQSQIDLEEGAAIFESAPVARFPIVGQIMEPGRSFHPSISSLTVQAIYDAESIALLVRWHDQRAEQSGKNGPSLPVPPEEEAEAPGAGTPAGGESETSIWGEAEAASTPAGQAEESIWGEAEVAPTPADQAPAPEPQDEDSIWGDAEVGPAQDPFADPFAEAAAPAAPPSEFSDAVAVQLPSQVPTGARKPYFIFGDAQNSVDLWFFDLAQPEPLQFTGRGSAEIAPNDTGDVTGRASYDNGEWSVMFTRPLRVASGAPFVPGGFVPIAFSVWDGLSRERGNRRGLTVWYSLYLEPQEVPSAVGPMIRTALLILAIELIVIGWVRWQYRSRTRRDEVGERQPATSH
jgi:mono/diheme cytochrome c family protein